MGDMIQIEGNPGKRRGKRRQSAKARAASLRNLAKARRSRGHHKGGGHKRKSGKHRGGGASLVIVENPSKKRGHRRRRNPSFPGWLKFLAGVGLGGVASFAGTYGLGMTKLSAKAQVLTLAGSSVALGGVAAMLKQPEIGAGLAGGGLGVAASQYAVQALAKRNVQPADTSSSSTSVDVTTTSSDQTMQAIRQAAARGRLSAAQINAIHEAQDFRLARRMGIPIPSQ